MTTPQPLHILIIDQKKAHTEAISQALQSSALYCLIETGFTLAEYHQHVGAHRISLAIVNIDLSDGSALDVLTSPPVDGAFPILVTTDFGNERIAVETLKAGAIDFIVNSSDAFTSMPRTIARILREWNLLRSQKDSLLALKNSEERFRTLIELAPDGIIVSDPEGHITHVNTKVQTITGKPADQLIGSTLKSLWDAPSAVLLPLGVKSISDQQGKKTYVESHSSNMPDGTTQLLIRDVTDRLAAHEDQLEMERQLQQMQKLESLGVLASGIAHYFNNQLTIIIGNIDLSQSCIDEQAEIAPFLTASLEAAKKAAGLTHHMLDYAGHGHFVDEEIQLNDIVRRTEEMIETVIPTSAKLSMKLADNLPPILADPSQIQQLLVNILVNATESLVAKTGHIALKTELKTLSQDDLSQSIMTDKPDPGDFICISVKDTGCGMDSTTREKMFDPFFTTKFDGRGLGMSAVMGIVRRYHGAITLSSIPGEGTVISIMLPVVVNPFPIEQTLTTASKSTPANVKKILIVDDEETMLDLIAFLFTELGYTSIKAQSGQEAIAIAATCGESIFCAFLDLTLPDQSGRDVHNVLHAAYKNMRFVFSSGYEQIDIETSLPDKNSLFLHKPFHLKDLRKTMMDLEQQCST